MNTNNFVVETHYQHLELSTQILIREALYRGHEITILDEQDNFIAINDGSRSEYIKQATRTSADSYIAPLIMENKRVTKMLLEKAGIKVPKGKSYLHSEEAMMDYQYWQAKNVVVKPNSTNFGRAVFTLHGGFSFSHYRHSVDSAFREDSQILVESYMPGEEYRFLVVGGVVCAALKRIPANVMGDGIQSISNLVVEKNQDPRRGSGYNKPLEKIGLNGEEINYLKEQNLTADSIPKEGEITFLRKNSNISTGGDSIDVTDTMKRRFKDMAVAAASVVGARICGVDMIIPDPEANDYSIIELNFNPAIHIHAFPFRGKNRYPEKRILDMLGL